MEMNQNVLIVDDEIGPRESLRMILKPSYNVFIAENGNKALDIVKNENIDIVTLDLRMPGLDGNEVLKAIKKINSEIEVIVITGNSSVKSAIGAIHWGVYEYITKPFNVAEIISVIRKAAERRVVNLQLKDFLSRIKELDPKYNSDDNEYNILKSKEAGSHLKDLLISKSGNKKVEDEDFTEFVKILSCTFESHDIFTEGHSSRVSMYADILSDEYGFSEKENKEIQVASFLHDIGKIGIGDAYMKKTPLTEDDWRLIKEHPERGFELIDPLKMSSLISDVVLHHHERIDGKGYPDGLAGNEISIASRIVCLADSLEAMTSDRPYRKALSREEVIKELKMNAGTQFDAELVSILLRLIDEDKLDPFK